MVIITNGTNAVMYYSESQWLDATDADLGQNASAFRVPNSISSGEILGTPPTFDPDSSQTNARTDPMTEAEVQAIATEVIFTPSGAN
jgi:hypothetical protein